MHHLPLLLRFNGMLFVFLIFRLWLSNEIKQHHVHICFSIFFFDDLKKSLSLPFSYSSTKRRKSNKRKLNQEIRKNPNEKKRKTNASKSISKEYIKVISYWKRNTISGWAAKKERESASLFYILISILVDKSDAASFLSFLFPAV